MLPTVFSRTWPSSILSLYLACRDLHLESPFGDNVKLKAVWIWEFKHVETCKRGWWISEKIWPKKCLVHCLKTFRNLEHLKLNGDGQHNMGTSYLPNSDLLTCYVWKLIGMNPELLYTLIKESLTNISPRLLVQLTQDSSNHRTQCQQEPLHLRSQEGEKGKTMPVRLSAVLIFPSVPHIEGPRWCSSRGLYFSSLELDQGGSRYVSQNRYGRGFSWGADNGNFGSWGTLARIWEIHASVDDDQPPCPKRTIPFYIHGDEGRGQCKRPLLVLTFQPVFGMAKRMLLSTRRMRWTPKSHWIQTKNTDYVTHGCIKKCLIGCGLCYSVSWLDATTHPGQLRRDIETQLETSASFILNPASRKPIFFPKSMPCCLI